MSIPQDFEDKYKDDLASLIQIWGLFRKGKQHHSLADFYQACNHLSHEIATFALYSLQQVITSMSETALAGLDNKKEVKELIKEIDWLMNQLIRGSHEVDDPFLKEATATKDLTAKKEDEYLAQQVSAYVSQANRADRPNIVIIDDQLSVAQALSRTLEDFSLNVSYFTSIDGFKKVLGNISVDLVLLDVVMPNITQNEVFDFAAELVKQGIKVISCSSNFTFDARLLAVRANISDYVVKPVNTYVLVEKIGRTLGLQQESNYQIVIVDDQETMGTFYKSVLEQVGCDVIFFSNAKSLFEALEDMHPDMFLLDMMMPDVDGLEVAKMIRQEHKLDFAPIIFITGDDQVESRIEAIDAGADDVINKASAVNVITSQVLTRLHRASKVRAFVAKDPLTGVLNHGQIVESANQSIRSAKRRKAQSTIAVIDVDHFKKVNDNYGHVAGDKVLCALGQLLTNSVRESDLVGRYGGEEFVIIFEDCDLDDAANKIQLIKDKFSNMRFNNNRKEFAVTFSAGLVELSTFDNVMPAVATADRALYKAKEEGRNKVIKYRLHL